MKIILPDSVRIMDLLDFAYTQGLEIRRSSNKDELIFQQRASNVRQFPRPTTKPEGSAA